MTRGTLIANKLEYEIQTLICLVLSPLKTLNSCKQFSIGDRKAAKSDKRLHDPYAHGNGNVTVKHSGKHRHSLLCKNMG